MDPSLLIWFRTPLGTLMTASRTVNFQQAEVSRLVSHLREQISKQNKALKKAAQQIRENEKTLQTLEDAKREIIVLKQELRKVQNNGGSSKGNAAPHAHQPTGVIRPIPHQSTSGEGIRLLASTSETRSDTTPAGGTHNDGFGIAPTSRNGGRGMNDLGQSLQLQQAQQQRPLQQAFTQNIPESRMQNPAFRNYETGVILSDRTKGMGTFKHPDILGMSPRKRLRTEHDEGPQQEPVRSLGLQSLREGQNFTPNPPNTVNQSRISLPPAGTNGTRPGNLIQSSSKSLLYPNQRNGTAQEDFHAIGLGGRLNPDVGMDIERNISRTSSRASARERLQQFKFDGHPAQIPSSPFAYPQTGFPRNNNLRPSTAMDSGSRSGPIPRPLPTTARPQSVADRANNMTPRPGTASASHHFTPRGKTDTWIAPAATTGNSNHSRFMPPGRRPS